MRPPVTPLALGLLSEHARPPRKVCYVAHPLRPTPQEIASAAAALRDDWDVDVHRLVLRRNLDSAKRWLSGLRRCYPTMTFIAPWIAAVEAGADDSDPRQRAAGLADAEAVIHRCDGLVLCGGCVSDGMERERDVAIAARRWIVNLTGMEIPDAAAVSAATHDEANVPGMPDGSPQPSRTAARLVAVPGYELLAATLDAALEQAQAGKGRDRHSCGEPFHDQQIVQLGEWMGSTAFAVGQVCKKSLESTRLSPERARHELLGAINYAAAAVIQIDRQTGKDAP